MRDDETSAGHDEASTASSPPKSQSDGETLRRGDEPGPAEGATQVDPGRAEGEEPAPPAQAPSPPSTSSASAIPARIAGWFLVLCFVGASTAADGFRIVFRSPFTRIGQGEAVLWLATVFLLTPAGFLIGYGHRGAFVRYLAQVRSWLAAKSTTQSGVLWGLGIASAAVARLCNALVLGGYPVTDDEWAAQYGGQALAGGKLLVTLPFKQEAFPTLFMYTRGTAITSMDWLGTQLAWALDEVTATDHLVFAISAAIQIPAIAYVVSKRLSPSWGVVAAFFAFASPMGFALSMTTHGHLLARGFFALTLAAHTWTSETWSPRRAAITGLALGAGLISRPVEVGALALPILVWEVVGAFREGGARRRALTVAAGVALLPILAMMAHSYGVTGTPLPPRNAEGAHWSPMADAPLWTRFGSNVAFNLLRLGVWFLGPIGVALVVLGTTCDRFTKLLAGGVAIVVFGGFAHTFVGIHAVGPINQSSCVGPLAIIATFGLHALVVRVRAWALDATPIVATILAAIGVTCVGFNTVHGLALHRQARIQSEIYGALDAAVPLASRPAVVLAPPFSRVWSSDPRYAEVGTWVFEWRRPRPDLADPVMVLQDGPGVFASVRAAFPLRTILRVGRDASGRPTLAPADAVPEPSRSSATPTDAASQVAITPELDALAAETFGDARGALAACLREERAVRPGVAGKLPVTVVVDDNGLVVSARLGESTLSSVAFDDCAEQALLTLVFPPSLSGKALRITYDLQ